jgi:ribosomal protein S18 acetylase RimI-like enzyme
MTSNTLQQHVQDFSCDYQDKAKELILFGLGEHWGTIDYSLNPDLNDIQKNYINSDPKNAFKIVLVEGTLIATGALIREDEFSARIVRMSVHKDFRNQGVGRNLLKILVQHAIENHYHKIVLETTKTWTDVIRFYKAFGFVEDRTDDDDIHLYLDIST